MQTNSKINSAEMLIDYLRKRDVILSTEKGRLRYRAPKGTLTPEILAELADHKEEILNVLRREDAHLSVSFPPLAPISRTGELPLSFAQQRLWFLDQLVPNNAFYNVPVAFRLTGQVTASALRDSFRELLRRQEILRASFPAIDTRPTLQISPEGNPAFPIVDVSFLAAEEREKQAQQIITQEAQRPFNLWQEQMFRPCLIRISEDNHIVLIILHHIVFDGWSMSVLLDELGILYQNFSHGLPSPLVELPIQYLDFSAAQREWINGSILAAQLAYWKEQLKDNLPLDLPTDYQRPIIQSFRGAKYSIMIDKLLGHYLKALSRKEGVTLFMTLLATFKVLLHRYTGQRGIAVGTPITNRNSAQLEKIIGFFANTLVLRSSVTADAGFREILRMEKDLILEAFSYQDLPFELLVEHMQPERDVSYSPLFQVMFVLRLSPMTEIEIGNLKLSPLEVDNGTVSFELALSLTDTDEGLQGVIEYSTDLYERSTIGRMVEHFQSLLHGVVADADRNISSLPLLSDVERHQLIHEWNDTDIASSEQCLHELFEIQVGQTSDTIAITQDDQQLSYEALNSRANQIANYLRRFSIGPESIVGIYLERDTELIVALLAVLKAGAAYLPLDPAYPDQWLKGIIEDANISLLLSHQTLEMKPTSLPVKVICLDREYQSISKESHTKPLTGIQPKNLAYIIYTSGSTGKPKGVAIEHRSANLLMKWAAHSFSSEELECVLAGTSICFDLSIFEIFVPLSFGKRILFVRNIFELQDLPEAKNVTLINTVPSAIQELIRNKAIPNSVRSLNVAGETLKDELVRDIFERGKVEIVRNLYGPSEDTTYSTYAAFEKVDGQKVSIGHPIYNTQVYLCDRRMEIVPLGIHGILYLGGGGLARCYHQAPELTVQKFTPDPFTRVAGGRLYMTEDLARYQSDSCIEFLGRIDDQVKIRGYRIELGEVEAALLQHPSVESAVVIDRTDDHRNKQLVAYIVLKSNASMIVEDLRKFVKNRLPEYMAPAVYVQLSSLPLTINGKINRQELPEPNKRRPEFDHSYVAPRSHIEKTLTQLWSAILGIDSPGIYDHFIELGGDSILAIQLVSRASQLNLHFTPRDLFQYSTIVELASIATIVISSTQHHSSNGSELKLINPISQEDFGAGSQEIEEAYPLSPMQQGMLFHCLYAPELKEYSEQVHCILPPDLNVTAFKQAWQMIIDREAVFRTSFVWENVKEPLQLIHHQVTVPWEDHLLSGGNTVEFCEPLRFVLSQAPLIKFDLYQLGNGSFHLIWSYHHLIMDGWSLPIVLQNVFTCYEAISRNHMPVFEAGGAFRDYIAWLTQQDQSMADEFWCEELSAIDTPTRLSLKMQNDEDGYGLLDLKISNATSLSLQTLARQHHLTPNTILQCVWGILLSRYSGERDVIFGGVVSGRPPKLAGVESIVGNFLNTLPVRVSVIESALLLPWLSEHQDRQVVARQFEYSSLARIQKMKNLFHGAALFDTVMVFENYPINNSLLEQSGRRWHWKVHSGQRTGYTLLIAIFPGQEHLLRFTYLKSQMDRDTIMKIADHMGTLIEWIVTHPEKRIYEASLMSDAERQQLLLEWNPGSVDISQEMSFQQLFEQQVERTPDSIAVIANEALLSYDEINRRANKIAWKLLSDGIKPDAVVAVLDRRSINLMISILAIFKAGGGYLPLDPFHPIKRISQVLTQSNPQVVIVSAEFSKLLSESGISLRNRFIVYEIEVLVAGESPETNLSVREGGGNLAYIIYTSGSSGIPKGVMIEQRGMINHLLAKIKDLALTKTDLIAQTASQCFDISVWQCLAGLMIGSTVLIFDDKVTRDPLQLLEELEKLRISVIEVVPSFLTEMLAQKKLQEAAGIELAALRWMILTGEALSGELCCEWFRYYPAIPLLNAYGPTECSDDVTHYVMNRESISGLTNVPIGKRVQNMQLYVLDDGWSLLPIGVTGELLAGGVGVGRGYLNDAWQTAKSFSPHPFNQNPGGRLYKTGDLSRYLTTGDLEYLGRRDNQVKIRGFRIELGEIEAALLQDAAVKQCVVTIHDFSNGDKRIVAYLVLHPGIISTVDEWRHSLRSQFPEYFMPSFFIVLDRLPLTTNGKIDHKALPKPTELSMDSSSDKILPQNQIEQLIAEIWQEALEVEKIGTRDNFFDVGGHSLLMVQVHLKLREAINIDITLIEMFRYPTIASLAEIVSSRTEQQKHTCENRMVQKIYDRAAARRNSIRNRILVNSE